MAEKEAWEKIIDLVNITETTYISDKVTDAAEQITQNFKPESEIWDKKFVTTHALNEDAVALNLYYQDLFPKDAEKAEVVGYPGDVKWLWYLSYLRSQVKLIIYRIEDDTDGQLKLGEIEYIDLLKYFRYAGADDAFSAKQERGYPIVQRRFDYAISLSPKERGRIHSTIDNIATFFAKKFKDASPKHVPGSGNTAFFCLYRSDDRSRFALEKRGIEWRDFVSSGAYAICLKNFLIGMTLRDWTSFFAHSDSKDKLFPPTWMAGLNCGSLLEVKKIENRTFVLSPWVWSLLPSLPADLIDTFEVWAKRNRLAAWDMICNSKGEKIDVTQKWKKDNVTYTVSFGTRKERIQKLTQDKEAIIKY